MKTKKHAFLISALCAVLITAVVKESAATIIIPPSYLELSCGQDYNTEIALWLEAYTVNSFCDVYSVTNDYAGGVISFCTEQFITVTWTAYSNNCVSPTTAISFIHVIADTTPPVLNVPSNLFMDCHDHFWDVTDWINDAEAHDICSGTDVNISENFTGSGPLNFCTGADVVVTWTATDGCSNTSTASSTIVVSQDNVGPHVDPPGSITIECDHSTSILSSWVNNYEVLDNCTDENDIEVSDNYNSATINFCTGNDITVVWTATDGCGNTGTASSTINVIQDTDAPDIDCAADIVRTCFHESDFTQPTISDNCLAQPTLSVVSTIPTPGPNGSRIYCRTWRAQDACGNSSTCHQCITIPSPLIVDAGPNKIVYIGYPDSACARLQSTISGGQAPYARIWSTAGNANLGSGTFINVCPTANRVYYLTVTDGNGCIERDSVKVCVFDVRCGNNLTNVLICHGTGSASNPFVTLCVDLAGAKDHMKKHSGEKLGACGMNKSCTFPVEARMDNAWKEAVNGADVYLGAFPNPFTNSTTISFMLPENDFTIVKVIDITGRVIANLYDGETEAGNIYDVTFDGSKYSNGIYFLALKTSGGETLIKKLIINR